MKGIDDNWRTVLDQMPGAIGCKTCDSVFLYVNEEYARIAGLQHPLDAIGRKNADMPCNTAECSPEFISQDQAVIASRKSLQILDIHPFADGEWHAYTVTKRPLYGPDNPLIGTIFHGTDITSNTTVELGSVLRKFYTQSQRLTAQCAQGSYLIGEPCGQIDLTPRELEVLFFLIRGSQLKNIARILDRSPRTVEEHVNRLKEKFKSRSKADLIDQAIYLGFLSHIPRSLFNQQLSIALKA